MPATLLPNVLPASTTVRPIHRSLAHEAPALAGEDFDAALSEAQRATQPERVERSDRKQEKPPETQSAEKPSRKEAVAKSKKPAEDREDEQPVEATGKAGPKAEAEGTAEAIEEAPAEDEASEGAQMVVEEEVADEEGETAASIDPALLVPVGAQAATEGEEVDPEATDEASQPLMGEVKRPASIQPNAKVADTLEEAEMPPADDAILLTDEGGEGEAPAVDLTDLEAALVPEGEESGTAPVAVLRGAVAASGPVKPVETQKGEPIGQPLTATAGTAETETGESPADGQGAQERPVSQMVMADGDDVGVRASDGATTFEGELLKTVEKPSEATAQVAVTGGKAQQVVERQVVQQGAPSPLRAFVQDNHEQIVTGVRTQLLPNGGSMQIRLSPGDLGQMQISVRVVDGALSATFQTSSDDATRLLSHSLTQLKSALESQGVSVDRIQVTQAPREAQPARQDEGQQQQRDNPQRQQQQEAMQQEQQRRHLLNRMWARMAGGGDPLDLVA